METLRRMFSDWTLKEFGIVFGLVFQLVVQTSVIVWWGSRLNTTVQQVVVELQDVRTQQIDLRIRLAVQEALAGLELTPRNESGIDPSGNTPP